MPVILKICACFEILKKYCFVQKLWIFAQSYHTLTFLFCILHEFQVGKKVKVSPRKTLKLLNGRLYLKNFKTQTRLDIIGNFGNKIDTKYVFIKISHGRGKPLKNQSAFAGKCITIERNFLLDKIKTCTYFLYHRYVFIVH